MTIDFDKYAIHYVRITGHSKDPKVNYYYGVYKIFMRRSTVSSAGAALAYLKDNLNIPHMDNQHFTVMDMDRRPIDDVEPCFEYDAEEAEFNRVNAPEEPQSVDWDE